MGVRINKAAKDGAEATSVSDKVDEQDTEAIKAVSGARRFPQGVESLYKKGPGGRKVDLDPDDPVEIVNVSLSGVTFRVKSENHVRPKDGPDLGYAEVDVRLRPFQSGTFRAADVRRLFSALQRDPGQWGDLQVLRVPDDGDCGGMVMKTPDGRAFDTCPYLNCKTHGKAPNGIKHSVWQIQHRIARLSSEAAIRAVIDRIDSRPAVMAWAFAIMDRRQKARAERMGLSQAGGSERTY